MTPITSSFTLPNGQEVILETGKLATQAHGSCVLRVGKTMIFASAVSAYEVREGQSFFPLSVDYQEKFSAAGKNNPGGITSPLSLTILTRISKWGLPVSSFIG